MRRRRPSVSVAAMMLAATAASAAPAAAAHAPVDFSVKILSVNGSGCPANSVYTTAWPDRDSFRLVYSEHMAQAGGTSRPVDARKQCQVVMQVTVPQDVTYAVSSSEHAGFAHLEPGASAGLKVGHYFPNYPWDGFVQFNLKGDYDDLWRFTNQPPADKLAFKPCAENPKLVLTTEFRVDKGASDPSKVSYIAMDATAEGVWTTYHLTWKNCPH